jgi:tetratricopeptide (TPR) repeat protein
MNNTADPLTLLEGYLAQDPGNDGLRGEAFDVALRTGRRDRAKLHLEAGLAQGNDLQAWQLREGHWLMAQRDWPAAEQRLDALLNGPEVPPALECACRCDLALIALRTGHPTRGLERLAPCVQTSQPAQAAAQALWLRLKHHADQIDDLLADARRWDAADQLTPDAAGVASLAALDAGEFAACDAWSRKALMADPRQLEALVSQASLALARQSAQDAKGWLDRALQVHPDDGRAWSAMGFAEMLAGQLMAARSAFERALASMPQHIGTWHGLGWAALLQNDLSGARSAFQQALDLDRNFGESHGGMAVVLARSGDRPSAEAAIEVALRLDRQGMSAHYARAVLDGQAEDPEALQRLASRLLSARQTSNRR